jgi:hypothetical protein
MERDGMARELSDQDMALLSQYLDGELSPTEYRELETRLQSESALQSVLLRMQALNHRLRDALATNQAVPASITALLDAAVTASQPASETADQSGEDRGSRGSNSGATILQFPGRSGSAGASETPRWAYALAASFVGAIALALVLAPGTTPENRLPGNDVLVAAALDSLPSGNDWSPLNDGREIQPVLTFPHQDGRWCREYLLRGGASDWRAVSCREDGQWVTQAAGLESYLESSDAYQPAGAADSAPVAVFISQHAADIALGRKDEAALIASWK